MERYKQYLDQIDRQQSAMSAQLEQWSLINSGSYHLAGLARMLDTLEQAFGTLGGSMERLNLEPISEVNRNGQLEQRPIGQALRIRKRPDAPLKIYLGGHYDTVYGADHPFQTCRHIDGNTLNGPGLADMKGGLLVMLKALEVLEQSPFAANIGWEVMLNPDEEIGSIGSAPLLAEAAKRNHLGLIFEPSLSDGSIASSRKGTGNFTVVMHGKASHAGRDFYSGRNAVAALSEFTVALNALNGKMRGLTINPAIFEGGKALNIVPDLALMRYNIRVESHEEQVWITEQMQALVKQFSDREGFEMSLHGSFTRAPKPISQGMETLYNYYADCGKQLGVSIGWKPSGGCCDGNNLASHGLPNIDSLGVRGGEIHSDREFVLLDSLAERAKIVALLLMRMASGELKWVPGA